MTNKKSVAEILAIQKELSANNATHIETYINSDFSGTNWNDITKLKGLFGDYLLDNGYADAGNIYKLLEADYSECETLSLDEIKVELNDVIKPKEIEARTKY